MAQTKRSWPWSMTPGHLLHIATNGFLFPGDPGAPGDAPGGTRRTPFPGGPVERMRSGLHWFQPTHHQVPIAGLASPVRVLHLSDVHLRREDAWLEGLCSALRGASADLVVLTGDVVARGWTRGALHRFLGALPTARLGTFASMGNWEYWSGAEPDRWRALLLDYGIDLLVDEGRSTGPLHLVGVDDGLAGRPDRRRILEALHPTLPNVLLSHSPAFFPALVHPRSALVLSGHSHGGQIVLPRLGPVWLPRGSGAFLAGWYRTGTTHLFVHRGIGWSVLPVRIGCPPELAFLDLVPP